MGIQQGYDLAKAVFLDTVIFDITWAISALVTFLVLLLLTKEISKWKSLAFPVMVLIHIAGIPPFILLYVASAIIFAIENLSIQTIGALLSVVKMPKMSRPIGPQGQLDRIYEQENLRAKRKEVRQMFNNLDSSQKIKMDKIIRGK